MVYDHEEYLRGFAERSGVAFKVAASWKDMLEMTQITADGSLPCVVADYDESAQFENVGDDSLLEYRTYSVYFLQRASVGDVSTIPRAKRAARAMADAYVKGMLRDAARGRSGLTNLARESVNIASLGMVGDWAFGVIVTFTLVSSYVYAE